jgi:long-chain fatty acid transport protein
MIRRRRAWWVGCSVAASCAALCAPRAAHASGYLAARFGADHGTPAMANAYAVYFNPAAMGGTGPGTQLALDGTLLLRQVAYYRTTDALSPSPSNSGSGALYRSANTGQAKLGNVLALPYIGFVSGLGTRDFRIGGAAYVPFGGFAIWDQTAKFDGSTTAPGAVDGPQRWQNINGQILAGYATAAVSYTLPGTRLSLGVNGSFVLHHVSTVRARNADGSDDIANPNGSLKEGRSLLDATGFNGSFAAGLYYEVDEDRRVRLGLSYTSQPGLGDTRMSGSIQQQFGTDKDPAVKNDADLLVAYPDIVRFGVAARVSKTVEIRTDAEYVRWSAFKRQCVVKPGTPCTIDDATGRDTSDTGNVVLNVPRNFKDAMGLRFGGAWFANEQAELFGSLGVTTPAMNAEYIDPSAIDATRLYVTLGAKYGFSEHWALAGSANYVGFAPVDTKGTSKFYQYQAPSRSPSADGQYLSAFFFLNVNATYTF